MPSSSTNDIARTALVRLLCKLKLVDDAFVTSNPLPASAVSKLGPISFYSSLGAFEEKDALQLVAERLGIPVARLDKDELERLSKTKDESIYARISIDRWRQLRAIPLERVGKRYRIAVANPLDQDAKATIEFALGEPVDMAIAEEAKILGALSRMLSSDLDPIFEKEDGQEGATGKRPESTSDVGTADPTAPTVVRLLSKILNDTVECGASDVHLSPAESCLVVKVRVDGVLRELLTVPGHYANALTSRLKLLAGLDISEKRRPQDGRLRVQTGTTTKDIRVSTVPALHGENIVARVLSSDISRLDLDHLGMDEKTKKHFSEVLAGSSRVILVTGPTGSGKTSTLYASILQLRDGETNIITIEDPIEYRVEGITQLQVNSKVGLTFAESLRSVLRQDPDVVVVGEIRDSDTATIAMQCAQTGHIVLSTLHTNTAASAITRLRDLGVATPLIGSSLGAVLAQRLVRRLCLCAVEAAPETKEKIMALGRDAKAARTPGGCERCASTGYAGQVGIYSLLVVSEKIRNLIRSEASEKEMELAAIENGFQSLADGGLDLVERGVTSLGEVERVLGRITRPQVENVTVREDGTVQKPKVLLVEDDGNMRTILAMILERALYEVAQAEDGKHALELLYSERPDLIISDLMMPVMDGKEMIQIIRHRPEFKSIPVLLLTAADSEENELLQLTCGADDFVSKTADKRILLARVQNLLTRAGRV